MKNKIKIIFLFAFLILLTGCSRVDNMNYSEIAKEVFSNEPINVNLHLKGYSIYLPNEVTLVNDLNNNCTLYSSGDNYYLFIDLVGYYENVNNDFVVLDETADYSDEFTFDNKNGYVKIYKVNNEYLLEFVYNHAKIEVVTKDIKRAFINSVLLLNSISFNDKVIVSLYVC